MEIRKIFFWMHLIAGCLAGVVIVIMSLTGVLLTYERQINAWSARGAYRAAPPAGQEPMPVEALLEAVERQRELSGNATLTLRSDPREPAEIRSGREAAVYVNPYDGRVLGTGGTQASSFFSSMRAWHRWLGVSGDTPGRSTAKAITGAANLLFLFLVVSGAYIWLPRVWSWRHLRPITWFRGESSGKARDFNWHNVFGIWSLVPLFFVVITAVPISYTWGGDLLYWLAGTEPPQFGSKKGGPPKGERKGKGGPTGRGEQGGAAVAHVPLDLAGLNALWGRARNQVPGWQSISAPIAGDRGRLSFSIDTGDGGQPQKRSTLILDRKSSETVRWETFQDGDAGRRLRSYSRFLHTGEVLGLPGQTIAGIASFGGVMLGYTGISLSLRRLAAWRRRRNRGAADSVAREEAAVR